MDRHDDPTRCGACGGTSDDQIDVREHRYRRCRGCGTAVLSPLPTHDPADYYDAGYFTANRVGGYADYDADAAEHARNASDRLDRVQRHLPAAASPHLVDVGCASGYVLADAARRGWSVAGVDVSAWARERVAAQGHPAFATLAAAVEAAPRPPTSSASSRSSSTSSIRTTSSRSPPAHSHPVGCS